MDGCCPRGYECCPLVILAQLPEPLLERHGDRWECIVVYPHTGHIEHGHGATAEAAIMDQVDDREEEE